MVKGCHSPGSGWCDGDASSFTPWVESARQRCRASLDSSHSLPPQPTSCKSRWPSSMSYPRPDLFPPLTVTIVQATWTHSSLPRRSPSFRSCGPSGQVKPLLQTLHPIQRNIPSPSLAYNALPVLAPAHLTAASLTRSPPPCYLSCQPHRSFLLLTKHIKLVPAQTSTRLLPCPC